MTSYGYSLMCELHDPNDLLVQARRAEEVGFDFLTISDHIHPWLYSHKHSPYAWSVLGALAAQTSDVELVSLVTCRGDGVRPHRGRSARQQGAVLRAWEELRPRLERSSEDRRTS